MAAGRASVARAAAAREPGTIDMLVGHPSRARRRRLVVGLTLVAAAAGVVALAGLSHASAEPDASPPPGWRVIDAEPQFEALLPPGVFPLPLAIDFFSDCTGSAGDPGSCGPPPARWVAPDNPPEFCTAQSNRPSGITAQGFRDAVTQAVATWNGVEAAVGARYVGDCSAGSTWRYEDGVNQIGWDDARQAVVGSEAGVTRGSWFLLPGNTKEFAETDIVFEGADLGSIPAVCFESVVAHELGHALGFGHSDDRHDLMFPAFDPDDLSTCVTSPSTAERARLQSLYGIDRAPTVSFGLAQVAVPGQSITLRALASDPEGGPLTLNWTQTAGPPVTLQSTGLVATFTAPPTNATLNFQVTALDQFLHAATATVPVTVGAATSAPSQAPSLESFLGATESAHALLTWSEVPGAVQYELCGRPAGSTGPLSCQDVASPVVAVTWDTVVGTAPVPGELRLFSSGGRETALRACNARGCSINGTGGITGGLRWPAANVNFDYFVLAFDTPTLKFTIAGVVNVSGAPRSFNLNTGPQDDPAKVRIRSCGTLQPGAACLGFLGPSQKHFDTVDVTSRAAGAPSTEHRIRVR